MQSPRVLSFENLRGFYQKYPSEDLLRYENFPINTPYPREFLWQEEEENKKSTSTNVQLLVKSTS